MGTIRNWNLVSFVALLFLSVQTLTAQTPVQPKSAQPQMTNEQFLERISGTWKIAEATFTGTPFKTDVEAVLTIAAGKFTLAFDDVRDIGELKVDTSKSPIALDIIGSEGPNKGRTIPAIAKFDGEKLVICYQLDSEVRPDKFESPAGSSLFLAIYERQKSEPKK